MDKQLNEFAMEIAKRTKEIQSIRGDEAMTAQTELSLYIGEQMQKLLAAGLNVNDIQECIRAGMEGGAASNENETEISSEEDFAEASELDEFNPLTHFVAISEDVIHRFERGEISKQDFPKQLLSNAHLTSDTSELVTAVLGEYGKTDDFELIDEGGEVLADADSEAFIPEWIEFENSNGAKCAMCEPMVYKTVEEVKQIHALTLSVDEAEFTKRWNIKKLIKLQELDGLDAEIMKKQGEELCLIVLNDYMQLRDFYKTAAEDNMAVIVFPTY